MRNPWTYIVIILLVIITCCSKDHFDLDGWVKYEIKAGTNKVMDIPKITLGTPVVDFDFKVDSSWYYETPQNNGWSKICGFSEGYHHQNSARLVYKCIELPTGEKQLLVGAYCYVDGISPQENTCQKCVITDIKPGTYHCRIDRGKENYNFYFENTHTSMPASSKPLQAGYICRPYLGGDFTLEHNWVVWLKINRPKLY